MVLVIGFLAGCATSGQFSPDTVGKASPGRPVKSVRIGGEEVVIGGFITPVKETFEEENGADLSIVHSGPGEELIDLAKGKVDAVVSTQSLSVLAEEAAREKVLIDPATLQQFDVGKNDTVVFLNRKNRVKKLTRKQLKAIFTGKVGNWKQVGGANRPIVIVWNSADPAENEVFVREILKESPVAKKLKSVGSYEDVRSRVMATPGAIGIAPRDFVSAMVKVPKTPVVESKVILVTRGEPTPDVKRLLDLLKDAQFIQ